MKIHYYKTKLTKMGKWNTPPLDTETWHGGETNVFYKKTFGIPKAILTLYTGEDGYMHAYVPNTYFKLLHARINQINKKDFRGLEKIIKSFYPLDKQAKAAVGEVYTDAKKLSNKELARAIIDIRHGVHHVVIFDQFGWLAEEYWSKPMRNVLEKELGLEYGGKEYNEVLFALTKPEAISTTLSEKRAVLEQAIKVKTKKSTFEKSGKILAKKFGWMPVFAFGEPWTAEHYAKELKEVMAKKLSDLEKQFEALKNYREIRNRDVAEIVNKYKLSTESLQVFIEFGLAIDGRNEAEYFVSYAGQFLMPLFHETRKRLFISPKQLRELTEKELVECLLGKRSVEEILAKKGKYGGWGYDEQMKSRIDFPPQEVERLYKYVESYVKPLQGGDESKGACASPGKARGKIRIVPYPDQNNKVKTGDILVTYATTVDYLPAMKRAAAIITEVGGLTCHAAVVSREFGIPCIVALTNAMKNFKDGDMVEVDADKGIVRKISN